MALHPDAQAFLDKMRGTPQPNDVPIADFREAARVLIPSGPKLEIGRVDEVSVPGGDGQPLRLRIYIPEGSGPFPVMVWMHGGSFVRGTFDMFDSGRRAFAKASRCVIVAVDQRLSPESTFPAPLNDGYAALKWASAHVAEITGRSDQIGVAGESSGTNLAAALTLLTKERNGPPIAFQLLIEPLLDAHCSAPSVDKFADGYVLTKRQLIWMYQQYAPGISRDNPLISPLRAKDVRGLPPAAIVTIEYDPTCDEGEQYAQRLADAGVPVFFAQIPGMVHHFPGPELIPTAVGLLHDLFRGQHWELG